MINVNLFRDIAYIGIETLLMKKHILRKFHFETKFSKEKQDLVFNSPDFSIPDNEKIKKVPKGTTPFVYNEDRTKIFKGFAFRYKGQLKIIPEPDPILVYFHAAYLNYIQI